jgi:hypothetical protein
LSAVRDYLFNIFAAALHIGGRSSIRNLRMRHAVVTGTHLSCGSINKFSGKPKHAIPRNSASCKSAGSMWTDRQTDRLDESYVRSSSTSTSLSVPRHTPIILRSLLFNKHFPLRLPSHTNHLTFAPLQQALPSPSPVTHQSPLVCFVACTSGHLFFRHCQSADNSRQARRIQTWSVISGTANDNGNRKYADLEDAGHLGNCAV